MSQFGNNPYYPSGGAGGGYLTGGSPFGGSNASPGGMSKRTEASHSLRPVTIKQLANATQAHTDAEWQINGSEIGQVTIVGTVASVQNQTTNTVYWIDDGTARIEARHWIDTSVTQEDPDKWQPHGESVYARVTGALKTFGTKRYLNATNIRLVTDPHEIYFHILEAMTVTLIFERGAPPGPGGQQSHGGATQGQSGASAYSAQSSTVAAGDQFNHLPPLQRSIINFIISQPTSEEGVHVAAIARTVGGDAHMISDALDTLMEDGLVFSTIDESHFQATT